jgi:hypothetical protein
MNQFKTIQVEYDFDYIPSLSRFNHEDFDALKESDPMYFQVLTCQDYGVSPVFELNSFSNDEREDLAEAICQKTGWLVLNFTEIK